METTAVDRFVAAVHKAVDANAMGVINQAADVAQMNAISSAVQLAGGFLLCAWVAKRTFGKVTNAAWRRGLEERNRTGGTDPEMVAVGLWILFAFTFLVGSITAINLVDIGLWKATMDQDYALVRALMQKVSC